MKAIVLLSGGLDSATVLALARSEGLECIALSFDYGQKHAAELAAAARIATALGAAEHRVIRLDPAGFRGSALTEDSIAVPASPHAGIPATYVPARNTILLAHALGVAESCGAGQVHIGVNAVDYSGYPDCRPEFIDAFAELARVATRAGVEGGGIAIQAPLLHMSKADIIDAGTALDLDYSLTVSCYQADDHGAACGVCDACRFRRAGFEQAGVPDPTVYCN